MLSSQCASVTANSIRHYEYNLFRPLPLSHGRRRRASVSSGYRSHSLQCLPGTRQGGGKGFDKGGGYDKGGGGGKGYDKGHSDRSQIPVCILECKCTMKMVCACRCMHLSAAAKQQTTGVLGGFSSSKFRDAPDRLPPSRKKLHREAD